MIGIIDCGTSNLRSVENVFKFLGAEFKVLVEPTALSEFTRLVIPGVGTYAQAMHNLRKVGLDRSIVEFAGSGKPTLGICLGMQLLADVGTEPMETAGLGLIPGEVVRLPEGLRLPHVGWNTVHQQRPHEVLDPIKRGIDCYFVHSYWFRATYVDTVLATCDYGLTFPCIVARRNVLGIQFHPEKSQKHGLAILRNFLTWSP